MSTELPPTALGTVAVSGDIIAQNPMGREAMSFCRTMHVGQRVHGEVPATELTCPGNGARFATGAGPERP